MSGRAALAVSVPSDSVHVHTQISLMARSSRRRRATRVVRTGNSGTGRRRVCARRGAGTLRVRTKGPTMKLLIRITVLGLAAVGAKTLYDRLRPRVQTMGDTGASVVNDTLAPAFR